MLLLFIIRKHYNIGKAKEGEILMNYKNILVPIDGSDNSYKALREAMEIGGRQALWQRPCSCRRWCTSGRRAP